MEDNLEAPVRKIRLLSATSVNHAKDVAFIVGKLLEESTVGKESNESHQSERNVFLSCNKVELNIGDRVQVLSKMKTGACGDFGTVVKFHKQLVSVKLDKNKSVAKTLAKNMLRKKEVKSK